MKKFRRIFLVPGVLIIFFCFSSALLGAEFSADLKIKQPDKEYEFKYYAQDNLYRLEKLTGQYRILVIADRKLDITWALDPEKKAYIELKGLDAVFFNPIRAWEETRKRNTNKKQVGTETILGYLCEKYTYTYPEKKEPSVEGWYSPKLNQFIRQMVHYGHGDGLLEMTNIVEAPQDDSLFKVPADYQREKPPAEKAREKEAARPVLTKMEETIAPAGRYMGAGGVLRVKVEPDRSVRVVITNQIKEKSVYKVTPLRNGQPVEAEIIKSSLTGKFRKKELFFGPQLKLDETLIEVEKGLISAFVTKEYDPFDKVKREEYFLLGSGRGLLVYKEYKIVFTLTGDSQAKEASPVKIKFYKGEYKDVLKEENFKLANGQVKKWEFDPGQIQSLDVTVGESGGVKALLEQFPVEVKVKKLSKKEKQQLFQDIIHNKLRKVKALLDSGMDVNVNLSSTESVLMTACNYSNAETVKLLLSYGPDINYQDKYGNNTLTRALDNYDYYEEIVPLLLEAGADPNSKVGSPGKINFVALSKITFLALNSKDNKDYQIIEMFLSHGADPNQAPKTGTTPLMSAAYKGNVELVKLFLKYGADPSLKNKQGKNALDMAKKKNYQQVINLLQ